MMWKDHDEPLYEERLLGEPVRFTWCQSDGLHTIRAQWLRGKNPWEIETCEAVDPVRHLAIEKATQAMMKLISHQLNLQGSA